MFPSLLQTLSLCSLILLSAPAFTESREHGVGHISSNKYFQSIRKPHQHPHHHHHHHQQQQQQQPQQQLARSQRFHNKLVSIETELYELEEELFESRIIQEEMEFIERASTTLPVELVVQGEIDSADDSDSVEARSSVGYMFSPYKDITTNADWTTNLMRSSAGGSLVPVTQSMPGSVNTLTWAFATGECGSESWGGMTASAFATSNVAAFVAANKNYIVSTGGAAAAFTCGSDAGFDTFIQRYNSANLIGVDFDIEGGQSQNDVNNLVARVKTAQGKYPGLRFTFTIATFAASTSNVAVDLGSGSPNPLGNAGNAVMNAIQSVGLGGYYINLMVMDYGRATSGSCVVNGGLCDMGQSAIQAAMNLHGHFNLPYSQIELTPMSGANDSAGETFSIQDVNTMSSWARSNGIAGVHYWSYDRDTGLSFANQFASALGL